MTLNNAVRSVRVVRDYTVRVVFADSFVGEVDLRGLFSTHAGKLVDELRDSERFRQVRVENGAVTFPNGYDICPDVLRFYCEVGRVTSRGETDDVLGGGLRKVAEARAEYRV